MTLVSKSFSEIVTFSRSSNATRVGPTGRVEYAPHNLITYSEQLDNAAWAKYDATVTGNVTTAPNGTVTADLLYPSTTGLYRSIFTSTSGVSGQQYTISFYIKSAGFQWVALGSASGSNSGVYFDVINGVKGTEAVGTGTITNVGNGWYRCTITSTASTGTVYVGITLVDSNNSITATASGTSGVYIWGAQLSVGPYALDYTPTTSAAVYGPRFDYDPVTLAARGLLVEEQRTNLVTYSEQFDNAAWTKGNATITANSIAAPDGTVTADTITNNSTNGEHRIYQSVTIGTGKTYSIYAKAGTASFVALTGSGLSTESAIFNLGDGSVAYVNTGSASITAVGNGWYRCSYYSTAASQSFFILNFGSNQAQATPGNSYVGSGEYLYLWGAQLEAGSFATSYIPTVASTVTRSADVASVNTLSPWFNATEGTVFAEFDFIGLNPASPGINQGVVCFTDGIGASNNLGLLAYGDGSASRYGFVFSGSSLVAFLSGSASSVNTTYKSALATKANDFRLVNSGGSVISDTSGAMPTGMNQLLLGNLYFTTNPTYQNGHLRRVAYYPRALTTAELQALTA